MKENILGYNVNNLSAEACTESLFKSLREGKRTWLACFNPHSYAVTLKDEIFPHALKDADWLVPDGIGVVLASRLLGGTIKERVTGSDVFFGLNKRMNTAGGMRVFFLGATGETLEIIKQRMIHDYPDIKVVGTFSPPFKSEFSKDDNWLIIRAINQAKPDVLWVGMTAPKQEKWIYKNKDKLDVTFIGAIGAVFDFYAGKVKRSHPAFQKMGLEWLPRLLQEPRRLCDRMLISAPMFLYRVAKQRFSQNRGGAEVQNGQ